MPRRFQLALSLALPLLAMSVTAPMRARAQHRPAPEPPTNPYGEIATPEPPANPYAEIATTGTPATAEGDAAPLVIAERHAAPVPPASERRLDELALAAARAEPAPPHAAMRALDEVLSGEEDDPIGGMEEVAEAPVAGGGVPSRAETVAAIERVRPSIRACAPDQISGVVELRIVFNSTGRVMTARVERLSARLSPSQRSCIARAARRAQLASFARPRFEVTYPIRF